MLEGLRYAATDPVARITLLVGMVPAFLLIPSFSALMPVFAVNVFHTGPEGLGMLLSAVGLGGVAGGICAVYTAKLERLGLTQVVAVTVFAAALIGFALARSVRRRDRAVEVLRALGLHVDPPKASLYVWARLPEGERSSADYAARLVDATATGMAPH